MPPTYVLARDHLQRAATILQGVDSRSRQLRYIIERTISLMDETRPGQLRLSNLCAGSTTTCQRALLTFPPGFPD